MNITPDSQSGYILTAEGHTILQAELEHLTSVKRPEIAGRIRESQQHGEFSEDNSELDEVKFEQAMVENRIAELKGIFGTAHIIDVSTIPIDVVNIGCVVELLDLDFDDKFVLRLVSSVEADPDKNKLSNESPLGMAIVGHKAGDDVTIQAPDGKRKYKVVSISR